MSKTTNFLKLAIALIVGDDAEAKSLKIQAKANAAITAQIAVRQAQTLDLKENLEIAKENAEKALANNGNLISAEGKDLYISGLFNARDAVKRAEEALEKHLAVISFLESQLALVN